MKRSLFLILFGFLAVGGFAQEFWLMNMSADTLPKWSAHLELDARAAMRSNSLENGFTDKFLFGGFIGDDLKEQSQSNLRAFNRLGAQGSGEIRFRDFKMSPFQNHQNIGLMLQVEQRFHADMQFTDDLYKIAMNGNSKFLGEVADFDLSNAQALAWQKFGVGFFDKNTFTSVILSLVAGQEFYQGSFNKGQLYTSAAADTLQFLYSGGGFQSDTSHVGLDKYSGLGVSLDFRWNFPLHDGCGYFDIRLEDVGFVNWRGIAYGGSQDYTYTGVDVENILDSENPIQFPSVADSLQIQNQETTRLEWLPTRFSATLRRSVRDNIYLQGGIRVIPVVGFLPEVNAGYFQYVKPNLLVGGIATVGGFGKFRAGFLSQWQPSNSWLFKMGTDDLAGIFLDSQTGRSVYFGLEYIIKPKS